MTRNLADAGNLAELMHKLDTFKAPTIAKVQGAAFGGAVGLVACCDMAVAIEKTSFCLSEVKIGLIPAVISPYVVRAIGERASRRYFLTAERFFALEAKALGLLSPRCRRRRIRRYCDQLNQHAFAKQSASTECS